VQFVQLLLCLLGAGMHGRAVGAGWEQDGSRMGAAWERGPRERVLFLMSDARGWAVSGDGGFGTGRGGIAQGEEGAAGCVPALLRSPLQAMGCSSPLALQAKISPG